MINFQQIISSFFCLILFFAHTGSHHLLAAEQAPNKALHHFFNARLLAPKEAQISIFGNAKLGISPDWEFGTNLFGYLFKTPAANLSIKHRMFSGEGFQTSFTSHSFFLPPNIVKDVRSFVSLHGVVNTFDLSPQASINMGMYDLYINYRELETQENERIHFLSPMLGFDYQLRRDWALSLVWVQAIYGYTQASSDFGDIESELDLFKTGADNFRMIFLTTVISWTNFNLEPGLVFFGQSGSFYLNLFWRFHAR